MELVILEVTFILQNTSHGIFTFSMFFSDSIEITFIGGSITFLNGASPEMSTVKLACEFLAVFKHKLTVGAHLDSVFHVALVD